MSSRGVVISMVAVTLLGAGCKDGRSSSQSGPPAQESAPISESASSQSPVAADKILDVPGGEPAMNAVALSADGSLMAVGHVNGEIVLREMPSGTERWRRRLHGAVQVDRLVFSADGSLLAAVHQMYSVQVTEISTGNIIKSGEGGGSTRAIAFHPLQRIVAYVAGPNLIFMPVGDMERSPDSMPNAIAGERVDSVAFSADGRLLAAASAQGTLKIWTWPELTPHKSVKLSSPAGEALAPVSLALGGQDWRAAVNGRSGRVHVVDLMKAREERTFDNTPTAPSHGRHDEMYGSLAFTAEAGWLFAPDLHDRGLRILDLASGRSYPVFRGDGPFYNAMSISVPAGLVALLRPADENGGGPFGLEVWRLNYLTR